MHVLWKIFDVNFGLLAHNHVEVGAQVLSFDGSWRSMHQMFKRDFEFDNRLVIGLASIIL